MMIDKIMGLASIGSSVANVTALHRFLGGIIGVIALTILSAMMGGMLLICLFYSSYIFLVRYGLDPDAALITTIALATLITALLCGLTMWRVRYLRELSSHTLPRSWSPHLGNLASAFLTGFKARLPSQF